MKTLQQVFAEYDRRKFFGNRYSQTADQLASGPVLARKITGESLEFKPAGDRYNTNKDGQYLLDLPKPR